MITTELRYVLPTDVDQVIMDDDEVLLTRRGSRIPPQLVSADAMALLEQFRAPTTLTEAVLRYCASTGADPLTTLDDAFGVLVALTRSDVLVADGTDAATGLSDRHRVGERVGPATITARTRVLRDSEIWRGRQDDETPVVVKIIDQPVVGPGLLKREVAALDRLQGHGVPRLVWHERSPTGGALVITEIDGDPADLAALIMDDDQRRRLALAVLDAYVVLHDHDVLHGDVHPGNLLVATDACGVPVVTLIDFGLASLPGLAPPPRASGGEQLDPQAAAAALADTGLPVLDAATEQYAVAALLFRLLTGTTYLDLQRERTGALTMITSEPPRRFVTVDATPWSAGEHLLRRALAKEPQRRFGSVCELRDAFAAALELGAAPELGPRDHRDIDDQLGVAVRALDVTGTRWGLVDPGEAAHVTWFLRRVALLTGNVAAHDLAAVWSFHPQVDPDRADGGLARPGPRLAVTLAHRALADYVRTGRGRSLRVAQGYADRLRSTGPPLADTRVDVRDGPWAGLLLALEIRRPALARVPGEVPD